MGRLSGTGPGPELSEFGEFGVFCAESLTQGGYLALESFDPVGPWIRFMSSVLGGGPLVVELGHAVRD